MLEWNQLSDDCIFTLLAYHLHVRAYKLMFLNDTASSHYFAEGLSRATDTIGFKAVFPVVSQERFYRKSAFTLHALNLLLSILIVLSIFLGIELQIFDKFKGLFGLKIS
jgi:hypothetical protein